MTNSYRRDSPQLAQGALLRDTASFLRAWLADPGRVSAITPSGMALARLVTAEITPATGPVLELGAGTGVFTRALLARGVQERDLTLLEYGVDFARLLGERFPRARVLSMDAARLARKPLYEGAPVGAVVSGLPLLSMSPKQIMAILTWSVRLSPSGRLLLSVHLHAALSYLAAPPQAARSRSDSASGARSETSRPPPSIESREVLQIPVRPESLRPRRTAPMCRPAMH